MEKDEHYYYVRRLEKLEQRIRDSALSEANKTLLFKFKNLSIASSLKIARVLKLLYTMFSFSRLLSVDFEEADSDALQEAMGKIETSSMKESTKQDYRAIVRKFYKWLRKSDTYPPEVSFIRLNSKEDSGKLPEDLLSEEEVAKLINGAKCPMYRALVAFLYDTGSRVGEALGVKIKHISLGDRTGSVYVSGKTGERRILIVPSVPYLKDWLNEHPGRDNPEAPLWLSKKRGKTVRYATVRKNLSVIAKSAGIRKRVNPHNFRHSRATFYAKSLSSFALNTHFGWSQKSNMSARYVHLAGRDIDDKILGVYGIKEEVKETENKFAPKSCTRCGSDRIRATDVFCSGCGNLLDSHFSSERVKQEALIGKAQGVFDKVIADNPILAEQISKAVREFLSKKSSTL